MKRLNALAVFPHIHIQNANMISGPLSWGFPAMTAFLGAVHRLFRESDFPFEAAGVGVVCHGFWPQASRAPGNFIHALHLNRFPVDEKGSAASVIEEGRAHLEITLVLGIAGELETEAEGPKWAEEMGERLQGMSIAGGSVLPCGRQPAWHPLPDALSEQSEAFRNIRYRLLPGFALLERRELLLEHLDEMRKVRPEAGEVDALLDLCRRWSRIRTIRIGASGLSAGVRGGWRPFLSASAPFLPCTIPAACAMPATGKRHSVLWKVCTRWANGKAPTVCHPRVNCCGSTMMMKTQVCIFALNKEIPYENPFRAGF